MGRYSKDRHEYNNKLTGVSNNSSMGFEIVIQLIIIAIGGLIYLLYRLYQNTKKKKRLKCKNVNTDNYYNGNYSISYYVNNHKMEEM